MDERFSRTAMLLGNAAIHRLAQARVAVFGIGGVGGYAAEALARGGIGSLDLIDRDRVSISISTGRLSPPPRPWARKRRRL